MGRVESSTVYLPIHEWLIFMVNVGVYIPYMDPMGMISGKFPFTESQRCFFGTGDLKNSMIRWFIEIGS